MNTRATLGLRLYDALSFNGWDDTMIASLCEGIEAGNNPVLNGPLPVNHTPLDWNLMRRFGVHDGAVLSLSECRINTVEMLQLHSHRDLVKLQRIARKRADQIQAYLNDVLGRQLRPDNEPFMKRARAIYHSIEMVPAAAVVNQAFFGPPDLMVYEILEANGWTTLGRLVRVSEAELQQSFPKKWYAANILQWERQQGLIPPE